MGVRASTPPSPPVVDGAGEQGERTIRSSTTLRALGLNAGGIVYSVARTWNHVDWVDPSVADSNTAELSNGVRAWVYTMCKVIRVVRISIQWIAECDRESARDRESEREREDSDGVPCPL